MLKAKRTEKEILDDFKKITGTENPYVFISKVEKLIEEWVNNSYDLNQIFKFSDNFSGKGRYNMNFPKEINIIIGYLIFDFQGKEIRKLIDQGLDPNRRLSDGSTSLMNICKKLGYYYYDPGNFVDRIKKALELEIDKNAVDEKGQTALDYLFITAKCKKRFKLIEDCPELKEVLAGFLTGKEIRTDNIAFVEQISLLEEQVQQLQKENLGLKEKLAEQVQRGSIARPKEPINFANSKESKVVQVYNTTLVQLADKQKALVKKDDEIYQKNKEIVALKERISTLETSTKLENPQVSTSTSSRGY